MTKASRLPRFDRYHYYSEAVQSPEADLSFAKRAFRFHMGDEPYVLAEDFCAAFLNCCEWVRQSPHHRATAIDIDEDPLIYGRRKYLPELTDDQRARVTLLQKSVLDPSLPQADIVLALNFSYFIFKERPLLLEYFRSAARRLEAGGILILDCFGGRDCLSPNEGRIQHRGFEYFWDQKSFNPITGHARFAIHFQRKSEPKRFNVFTYDWRLWTLPELRDLLAEAGFDASHVYWEGSDHKGEGNGRFHRTEKGDDADSWIAYVVATKDKAKASRIQRR